MDPNEKIFDEGKQIFKQGDKGGALFFVKQGQVELTYKDPDNGATAVIGIAEAPAVLGTLSFLEDEPRSASARALTKVTCIVVNQIHRENMLKKIPKWFEALVKDMSATIRRLNREYTHLKTEYDDLDKRWKALRTQTKQLRQEKHTEKPQDDTTEAN
jgi:CRP/FNR family transcriptional regulator, cyclic AMP receptor protein